MVVNINCSPDIQTIILVSPDHQSGIIYTAITRSSPVNSIPNNLISNPVINFSTFTRDNSATDHDAITQSQVPNSRVTIWQGLHSKGTAPRDPQWGMTMLVYPETPLFLLSRVTVLSIIVFAPCQSVWSGSVDRNSEPLLVSSIVHGPSKALIVREVSCFKCPELDLFGGDFNTFRGTGRQKNTSKKKRVQLHSPLQDHTWLMIRQQTDWSVGEDPNLE